MTNQIRLIKDPFRTLDPSDRIWTDVSSVSSNPPMSYI